ncbi:peptide deformylase [Candidatus Wolfebacteria bacterium]|nr:MAG: peptide deformylase [Candidatus Wolfebacteria bacterium]
MTKILQTEHKTLRRIADKIPISDITSAPIQKVLSNMKKAMASQDDAVAIAAPQIDSSLRIFLIAPNLGTKEHPMEPPHTVFINPEIIKRSKTSRYMEEGCLSVRWKYGRVKRSDKATVRAYDENGKRFTYGASGLVAQIFQHETDHLDGVLFTDKAIDVEDLPPPTDTTNH